MFACISSPPPPPPAQEHYGNLSIETIAQLPQQMGPTGDVHVAIYDYPNQEMLVGVGLVDEDGKYGDNDAGYAAKRPFLRFDLDHLWNFPNPGRKDVHMAKE